MDSSELLDRLPDIEMNIRTVGTGKVVCYLARPYEAGGLGADSVKITLP